MKPVVALVAATFFMALSHAYEVIDVVGGGTIQGTIVYSGNPIAPRTVIVAKDQETCGHDPREIPRIELGDNGGLVGATVLIEGIEKGKAFEDRIQTPVIDQKDCQFVQLGTRILRVGEKFKVRNSDPVLHNIHAKQHKRSVFNQGQPFQGMEFESQFEKSGPVVLNCDAHSWMWAHLYVTDHPYATLSDENGSFELTKIPPGEYKLKVQHPFLGEQARDVLIQAGKKIQMEFEYSKRIRNRD